MLVVRASTTLVSVRPAIIEMCMTTHALTDEIAHHGGTLIIGAEATAVQLHGSAIRTIDSPSGLRHRAMASFVLLLRVS